MVLAARTLGERGAMIEQSRIERAAEVLKTVAHPVRLRVVELLEHGEKTVTELKDLLGLTQPLTSQHLTQMRTRGVLGCRRDGTQMYYSIADPDVVKVINCIRRG
jgi:DNA-binding transcriptional ArsR family regulator